MDEELYLKDSYLKEFEAEIKEVNNEKYIVLDKTAFYPISGGQAHDTGIIKRGKEEFKVVYCGKFSGKVSHEVDKSGLKVGDKVKCKIDWDRRYKLMRMHTAAHLLSEVFHKEAGALITGNQLDVERSRIDFSLENYHPEKIQEYINKANKIIQEDLSVTVEFMSRAEAIKIPQVSKLAMGFPSSLKTIRIVNIGDYDIQADGGTHVKSTKEMGKIELIKIQNKGKNNRRIYFKVI